jgi:hypothetical protein
MPLLLFLACAHACAAPTPAPPPEETTGSAWATIPGLCEASALAPAAALGDRAPEGAAWVVGDNETRDRLFLFDADFAPLGALALATPIDDVEALAVTPSGVLVVGSHSTNRKGEPRPQRAQVGLLGEAAHRLDLGACAPCEAARVLRTGAGGLDIEGAVHWAGRTWLGLRGPLDGGKALLVPLEGDVAGAPRAIDLAGDGIRELTPWGDGLLLVAGPVDDTPRAHRLWWLAAPEATPVLLDLRLPPSSEGIAVGADGRLTVVTDGSGKPGAPCETPATWAKLPLPPPPTR